MTARKSKICITEISKRPVCPKIVRSVRNIIEREGYIDCNAEIREMKPHEGILISLFFEVEISGSTVQGSKKLNIFVKRLLPDQNMSLFDLPEAVRKEAFVYEELFKFLAEAQDKADVPKEDRLITPKVYETDAEYVMIENLTKQGLTTLDRKDVITFEFAKLSIQALARFHAFSFILQERSPDYFKKKIMTLKLPMCIETWIGFARNMYNFAATCLENEVREKVDKYIPTSYEKYARYAEDPNMTRCMVHGDFKLVNIMYKMENNAITDLIPVDFQTIHYGCPIIDFLFFIFTGSDQKFRRNHLETLKDVYHDTMTNYLKYFNIDVNKYLSRADFEKMYREKLDYGLMLTAHLMESGNCRL
ncbi:uncharacterized protein LOC113520930 [Galleria mellonella]|uniref:Uncharacterized protein LOC113520930 n=1 Tax=Galleria mellonella TaxID=7137 RepID=A0A6J1WZX1_GALME|nr:uncharacterized protein LOC113520930 [Galleria mellonella]